MSISLFFEIKKANNWPQETKQWKNVMLTNKENDWVHTCHSLSFFFSFLFKDFLPVCRATFFFFSFSLNGYSVVVHSSNNHKRERAIHTHWLSFTENDVTKSHTQGIVWVILIQSVSFFLIINQQVSHRTEWHPENILTLTNIHIYIYIK